MNATFCPNCWQLNPADASICRRCKRELPRAETILQEAGGVEPVAATKTWADAAAGPAIVEPADISGLQLKIEFDKADRIYRLGEKRISGTLAVTADSEYQVARVRLLREWRRSGGGSLRSGGDIDGSAASGPEASL